MDFTMRAFTSSNRFAALLLCLFTACAAAPAAGKGFVVREVNAGFDHDRLVVTGSLDLELSDKAEEALSKGIPIDVLIEFSLNRERRLFFDKRIGEWTLRARIHYHALSGLYLVTLQDQDDPKSFPSARSALKFIGTLSRVSFPAPDAASDEKGSYWLGLRVRMDVESLPAPLRPLAYVLSAWRLKSGWTEWPVLR